MTPPPSDDDLGQMQQEWRAIVLSKLSGLELGQLTLQKDLIDIRLSMASLDHLDQVSTVIDKLQERVKTLEQFQQKLLGVLLALNVSVMLLGWFYEHFVASH